MPNPFDEQGVEEFYNEENLFFDENDLLLLDETPDETPDETYGEADSGEFDGWDESFDF